MDESGYDSSEIGFSFGTKFEQYDNLFFNPTFRTVAENSRLIHRLVHLLKNKKEIISLQILVIVLTMMLEIKSFKQQMVSDVNLHKLYI